MATTPILGLTKLEVGQASKEVTINGDLDILDSAVSGNASGAIWARVYHNANQSITNTTATALAFNSERWDTNVIHDTVTNNSRLTCKTAGIYQINGNISWATHATGLRILQMKLNGATIIAHNTVVSVGGAFQTTMVIGTTYQLAVNDYLQLEVYQNSGGALNVETGANYSPEFMMTRLGK
jgi:hypothetical protein